MSETDTKLMYGAGFKASDVGPFAEELRQSLEQRREEGLVYASPGTWAAGGFWKVDAEVRAKAMLAVQWNMAHGHSYRVECIDPPIYWQLNARTMKRRLVVRWSRIPDWFGDRWRQLGMHWRVWRDRKLVNPYL